MNATVGMVGSGAEAGSSTPVGVVLEVARDVTVLNLVVVNMMVVKLVFVTMVDVVLRGSVVVVVLVVIVVVLVVVVVVAGVIFSGTSMLAFRLTPARSSLPKADTVKTTAP